MPGSLILFLDDAPTDAVTWMPNARRLRQQGTEFSYSYATSPVCAPSRAGLLLGRYAQNTGVFRNATSGAGSMAQALLDGTWSHENMGKWLENAGVRTLMIGKYHGSTEFYPPNNAWTTQRAIYPAYETLNYTVRDEEGRISSPRVWVNDYITSEIKAFIAASEAASDPWVVYWASASPHWPFVPPPGDPMIASDATFTLPPQHGEGWPPWIESREIVADEAMVLWIVRGMAAEVWDVDRCLGDVIEHVRGLDALDESTIYVTSDNGVHRGDHRHLGPATKNTIYEPATRVPLIARGPDYSSMHSVDTPVALIDITADILTRYGATSPWPLDGVPLRDVAADPGAHRDRDLLIQVRPGEGDSWPAMDCVVHQRHKLVRADAPVPIRYELYDLADDPGELVNLAYEPVHSGLRDDLEARLDRLLVP